MPIYPGRRPGTKRVTLYSNRKQHEWIVAGSKKDGEAFLARKRLEFAASPKPSETRRVPKFSDFATGLYAPHAKVHLGARSWKRSRKYYVAELVRHFGRMRVDSFSSEAVDAFVTARQAAGMKASSVNNELRVLKTMLRWGREACHLPIPALKIKMLREGKRRVHCWSHGEVRRLYAAARKLVPEMLSVLHFLLDTGVRKGEAIAAEWSWVDWERRLLRIPVTEYWHPKDWEAREVPLSDALLATLRALPRRGPRIFPTQRGDPYAYFPDDLFHEAAAGAKLKGGPHTTRHTFASHFLTSTPDLPLLAAVMGHSTTHVTELYAHLLPGHLEKARNAVQLAPGSKLWRETLATRRKRVKSLTTRQTG